MNKKIQIINIMVLIICATTAFASDINWNNCQYSKKLEFTAAGTNYPISNIYDPGRIAKVYDLSSGEKLIATLQILYGTQKSTTLIVGNSYRIDIYSCPYLTPECVDENSDTNEFTKGYVSYDNQKYYDKCDGYNLLQVKCEAGKVAYSKTPAYDSYVCQDGVFVEKKTCTDADNGKNIFTKAEASDSQGHGNTDYCKDSSTVREMYCENDQMQIEDIDCGQGYECKDGACVQKAEEQTQPEPQVMQEEQTQETQTVTDDTPQQFCEDSDAGDPYTAGYIEYLGGKEYDVCVSATELKEFICSGTTPSYNRIVGTENYECKDGRFVKKEGFCTDTDGFNLTKKGYIKDNIGMKYDYCISKNILLEMSCENNARKETKITLQDGTECEDGKIVEKIPVVKIEENQQVMLEENTSAAEELTQDTGDSTNQETQAENGQINTETQTMTELGSTTQDNQAKEDVKSVQTKKEKVLEIESFETFYSKFNSDSPTSPMEYPTLSIINISIGNKNFWGAYEATITLKNPSKITFGTSKYCENCKLSIGTLNFGNQEIKSFKLEIQPKELGSIEARIYYTGGERKFMEGVFGFFSKIINTFDSEKDQQYWANGGIRIEMDYTEK